MLQHLISAQTENNTTTAATSSSNGSSSAIVSASSTANPATDENIHSSQESIIDLTSSTIVSNIAKTGSSNNVDNSDDSCLFIPIATMDLVKFFTVVVNMLFATTVLQSGEQRRMEKQFAHYAVSAPFNDINCNPLDRFSC